MLDRTRLRLGADSAEKDVEVGLMDYFCQNDAYAQVVGGHKTIIVGNRGVGKSAIFKYLAQNDRNKATTVIELSPEDYSYEILSGVLKKEHEAFFAKQSSYSVSWQFLIYSLVFKELVTKHKGMATGAARRIYEYVRDNLRQEGINPIGLMINYLKRLEGIKVGKYEFGARRGN